MPSGPATCCKVVAKRRASAKPCISDGLLPLRICRSSAVWAAVVPWKVMTTLPARSSNVDAVTPLAVETIKGWPDRLCISVKPRADALDGSSEACAAFSKHRRLGGAVANRTGGGGSGRIGFPMNEVSLLSALMLIAPPQERFAERFHGGEELDVVPGRETRGSPTRGDVAAALPADLARREYVQEFIRTNRQAGARAGSAPTCEDEGAIRVSRVREV